MCKNTTKRGGRSMSVFNTEEYVDVNIDKFKNMDLPTPILMFINILKEVISSSFHVYFSQTDILKLCEALEIIDWTDHEVFKITMKGNFSKTEEIWNHFDEIYGEVFRMFFNERIYKGFSAPNEKNFESLYRFLKHKIKNDLSFKEFKEKNLRSESDDIRNSRVTGSGTRNSNKGTKSRKKYSKKNDHYDVLVQNQDSIQETSSQSEHIRELLKKIKVNDEFIDFLSLQDVSQMKLLWRKFELSYRENKQSSENKNQKKRDISNSFQEFYTQIQEKDLSESQSIHSEIKKIEAQYLFSGEVYQYPDNNELSKLSEKVAKASLKVAGSLLNQKIVKNDAITLLTLWKHKLNMIYNWIETLNHNIQSIKSFSEDFKKNKTIIKIKKEKQQCQNNIELARKFGEIFASKALMRMKREKLGCPDIRKIFRSGLKYQDTPIKLFYRKRNIIKKPNLVLLLDVSGSMLSYLPFLISFFYALNDLYQQIKTYVFVDEPVEVSSYFNSPSQKKSYDEIFNSIIQLPEVHRFSYSDYGICFQKFKIIADNSFDNRTVLVVVGDARNNFKYEALREFYNISMKATQTVWINPENKSLWNSGDSIIEHYQSSCDYLLQISQAEHLEQLFLTNIVSTRTKNRKYLEFKDYQQKYKPFRPKFNHYNYYPRYGRYY